MIAVVIVNWNGHKDTVACLESLACLPDRGFRVLVVDNASERGSVEHIVDWCEGRVVVPRDDAAWAEIASRRSHEVTWAFAEDLATGEKPFLTILSNEANLGFAGANNAATLLALADPDVTHVWILNNDTLVAPGAIAAQTDRMFREPLLGILGATVAYYDDPSIVQALGGARFSPFWGRGDHLGRGLSINQLPERNTIEPKVTYVLGAAMFVSRRFLETVGLMNESYFLFMEEMDWSARNKGRFRFGWEPGAVVFHKEGASTGSSQHARPSATSLYYQNVNLLRFNHRYHPAFLPVTLARLVALAGRYLLQRDPEAARLVGMALADFLTGRWRKGPIRL